MIINRIKCSDTSKYHAVFLKINKTLIFKIIYFSMDYMRHNLDRKYIIYKMKFMVSKDKNILINLLFVL